MTTEKRCTRCKETKPVEMFYKHKTRNDGLRSHCKACMNAYNAAHKATPEAKDCQAAYNLKRNYGIDPEQYYAMGYDQGGRCAICKETCTSGKRLSVDHDHDKEKGDPGYVRGLLCGKCNRALGLFHDDPSLLAAAIDYLTRNRP